MAARAEEGARRLQRDRIRRDARVWRAAVPRRDPRLPGRARGRRVAVLGAPDRCAAARDERGRRAPHRRRRVEAVEDPRRAGRGLPAGHRRRAVPRGPRDIDRGRHREVKILEFRSDTFTLPTPAMRKAMAEAEVGDDQYGEDPTVNRLEERAASIVGKEAGVYVASGMLGNLCGVLSQTNRGDEGILGDMAHLYQNEMGAVTVLRSIHGRTIPNRDGMPSLEDIEAAIRPVSPNMPRSALLCLENSHNNCGGAVITPAQTRAAAALAPGRGVKAHLDRARIFNAAAALGVDPIELTGPVDTVQLCFSKGLSAPVGSILCGSKETVARAPQVHQLLAGAIRHA